MEYLFVLLSHVTENRLSYLFEMSSRLSPDWPELEIVCMSQIYLEINSDIIVVQLDP